MAIVTPGFVLRLHFDVMNGAAAGRGREVYEADRVAVLIRLRPENSCDRDGDVGAACRQRTFRHLLCNLPADGRVHLDQRTGDAE